MDIIEYLNIEHDMDYTIGELNDVFSKHHNIDMKQFYMDCKSIRFLQNYDSSSLTINFINMFENVNEFETSVNCYCYSLAGNIISVILHDTYCKTFVYKITDHLLKLNMDVSSLCKSTNGRKYDLNYGIFIDHVNYDTIKYVVDNYDIIQNVRKLINNHDILLFDITNDFQFIRQILLITKCKHKNLPKFIITHKILYYYLLEKNEINNI